MTLLGIYILEDCPAWLGNPLEIFRCLDIWGLNRIHGK